MTAIVFPHVYCNDGIITDLSGYGCIPGNLGFEASIGATGWQILPGGLIFQWGTVTGDRGNLGAAYPMAFKERVFQVLLALNDKTAGEVEGISLYATRDNFTNKTILVVQNKGKDLLGVTTASYFAIGK